MLLTSEEIFKLMLAVIIGGLIGLERESRAKSAGFRTITLICLGTTLLTLISLQSGDTRIVANIVTGIGFLGAGAILRGEGRIKGLTTAASIWVAAALGMAIGFGEYVLAAATAVLVIVVLQMFGRIEHWADRRIRIPRMYEIALVDGDGKQGEIAKRFRQAGVRVERIQRFKRQGQCIIEVDTVGRLNGHEQVTDWLIADQNVVEFHF